MVYRVVGMCYVFDPENREKIRFPPEYFEELKKIDEKYDVKIQRLQRQAKAIENEINKLLNRKWDEIRELQKKYLERMGLLVKA